MGERNDVWQLADELQQDLRNAQRKLVRLRALIASRQPFAALSEADRCGECGVGGGAHTADCGSVPAAPVIKETTAVRLLSGKLHDFEAEALAAVDGTERDPTEGMPPDLVRVLRDPAIVIDRDREIRLADGRTLADHLAEWRNAPSNTASAHIVPDGTERDR